MNQDNQRVAALLAEFRKLESAGAGKSDHPQHDKRNELLDELQDAVGLGGKMVMEGDITRKADKVWPGDSRIINNVIRCPPRHRRNHDGRD